MVRSLWYHVTFLGVAITILGACPGCSPNNASGPSSASFGAGELERVKYNNAEATVDLGVGLWAWPLPMDYDEDGDMDLLVSSPNTPFNGVFFFENPSGEPFPVFAPPERLTGAIEDVQVSYVDGAPRVLIPGAVLENFSTSFDEEKRALYSRDSILAQVEDERFSQWKLVDFEGDGDLDILAGIDDWGDYGWDDAYDEEGNWTNGPLHGYVYLIENQAGTYVNQGRLEAGGAPIDVYGKPSPNAADFDGDGDLDLILGEFVDQMTWFENVGTREEPEYAAGRFLRNQEGPITMDLEMITPVAVDWDADGDVDLVVGDEDGRVAWVENTGAVRGRMPIFESPRYFQQAADNLKFGALATPVGVDWDNDGDDDLISGNSAGYLAFIENLDGGFPPSWAPPRRLKAGGETIRIMAGANGSVQGPAEAKWGYTAPSVADWDGDGLNDLVVNSIWGKVVWHENMGSETAPELAPSQPVQIDWEGAARKPGWYWWTPEPGAFVTQWRTTPYATDWNGDGLTDLVMLDHEGYLSFFERVEHGGTLVLQPGRRIFKNEEGAPLRLNDGTAGGSGRRKLTFVDWDQDGDQDLLVNSTNATLWRNIGGEGEDVQFVDEGTVADRELAGHTTSPTTVDWNADGVPDLLIGGEDGHFYYLQNPMSE